MTRTALALLLTLTAAHADLPAPTGLATTPVANQLGLTLNEVSFSWTNNQPGTTVHVLVASGRPKLDADVGDLWDSGRRTASSNNLLYRGADLTGTTHPHWKARFVDAAGNPGPWSSPQAIKLDPAGNTSEHIPHPTAVNGPQNLVPGAVGQALHFAGETTVAARDYPGLRTPTTTIAAWIKPDETPDRWQCIYRKEDAARRLIAIGKEGPFWGIWVGFVIDGDYKEVGARVDPAKLKDGNWHHVAASYDGTAIQIFLDGNVLAKHPQTGALSPGSDAPAHIGSFSGSGERFNGAIDDVRVYSTALNPDQVAALANKQSTVAPSALAAHWTFDTAPVANAVTTTRERPRNRIALVGGTNIFDMEKYGHFETAVTARWPHHDITFRNLGWPADDVFGTARGEFGSAHNTRSWQPPGAEQGFGFSELLTHVDDAAPSTIIVGYGAEAAFADTPEKMRRFQQGYLTLLDHLEDTGAHLVLLTPVRHEKHDGVLPDPAAHNARLTTAAEFIIATAKKSGHTVVDLCHEGLLDARSRDSDTNVAYRNGIHLSAHGHIVLATRLVLALGIDTPSPTVHVAHDTPPTMAVAGGVVTGQTTTKHGLRWDARLDQLPVRSGRGTVEHPWPRDTRLRLRIGDTVATPDDPDHNRAIGHGPDFTQAEELRQLVVAKNQYHRYKLRPINKAYIFLFRRHEMGHLADEMQDFDELIANHERRIALLRKPRTHTYELDRLPPWRSPRDYPDHEVPRDIPSPDPAAELAALTVADGFRVNLFAANPMVANPINLNWDNRGRAWVATSTTYPHIKPGLEPDDQIVILEDTDGDGTADKHTVFADGLTVPHSVMPVPGGAYVCSTTELLFLEDRDGDDVAESRRVVFTGFGNADVHHMIHGLRWAPWGDLYFTQSIYINSFVETAHGQRRMNGSGIWTFRPESERLDAYAVGMVNPWGFALDRWGQTFATDGAGGAGPHYIFPGGAYPSAVGAHRVLPGLIPGKPKNTAAEFVTGRHMPDHWQGSLLANDFRANRTVRYAIRENGSGYAAGEVETVLHSSHRSFRPVDLKFGPDGALYVVDWYNPIIDHGEVDFHHPLRDRRHGRIWRLTAEDRALVSEPDIAGADTAALLEHLKAPEQLTRTLANRELATKHADAVPDILAWAAAINPDDPQADNHRLEALWLLNALNQPLTPLANELLASEAHQARAATVRAISDWRHGLTGQQKLELVAPFADDPHPRTRLEAVNALRQIGTLDAVTAALHALDHPADNNLDFALELTVRTTRDTWLPAMQAGKPVFPDNPAHLAFALKEVGDARAVARLLDLVRNGEIAKQDIPNAARTIAALGNPDLLDAVLALAAAQPHLLPAVAAGATTNNEKPTNPKPLTGLLDHGDPAITRAAARLAGHWQRTGLTPALAEIARSADTPTGLRDTTCRSLAQLGAADQLATFAAAGQPAPLRTSAVTALATTDPTRAAPLTATLLASLGAGQSDLATPLLRAFLTSGDGPAQLAAALAGQKLANPVAVAALQTTAASGLPVPALDTALTAAGNITPLSVNLSPAERRAVVTDAATAGDTTRGRAVYHRQQLLCATCHTIENQGGHLGPDLSTVGSYMTPDSLLDSLLDPSASIKQGYETVVVTTKDNTVTTGLLQRKTETATLVRDPSGTVVSIPTDQIKTVDSSPVSLMPPGLTASLRRDELVDLLRYLTSLGRNP